MSKERELLQEIYDDEITMMELPFSTATKLVELLAEPEQKPVVKITSIHADGENLPVAITGVVLSDAVNIWDLPIKNNELLFLAPQKQEPLSYSRTADLFHANKKATNAVCYWAGVSDAEKAHGIGGGE